MQVSHLLVYAWIDRWVAVIIVQIKLMVSYFYFLVMKVFFLSITEKMAYLQLLKFIKSVCITPFLNKAAAG